MRYWLFEIRFLWFCSQRNPSISKIFSPSLATLINSFVIKYFYVLFLVYAILEFSWIKLSNGHVLFFVASGGSFCQNSFEIDFFFENFCSDTFVSISLNSKHQWLIKNSFSPTFSTSNIFVVVNRPLKRPYMNSVWHENQQSNNYGSSGASLIGPRKFCGSD